MDLFFKTDILEHTPEITKKSNKKTKKSKKKPKECTSYFIRKMEWMEDCDSNSGTINCTYCLGKLGNYSITGRQCSCGKFVAPAFQIYKSCVDSQIYNSKNTV